jgi:hypothetical protein
MKAFNESTEKQFSGLASSFSLTEKLGVERKGGTGGTPAPLLHYDTPDERS